MFYQNYGTGFAFVGNQYKLTVSDKEYFIDLLFYHLELRCYIVVELKARELLPIDAGQLNFYLSAVDDILRKDGDNPTIGILLCTDTDADVARYSVLHGNEQLFATKYKTYLPTEEQLKAEIETQKTIFELQQQESKKDNK